MGLHTGGSRGPGGLFDLRGLYHPLILTLNNNQLIIININYWGKNGLT